MDLRMETLAMSIGREIFKTMRTQKNLTLSSMSASGKILAKRYWMKRKRRKKGKTRVHGHNIKGRGRKSKKRRSKMPNKRKRK